MRVAYSSDYMGDQHVNGQTFFGLYSYTANTLKTKKFYYFHFIALENTFLVKISPSSMKKFPFDENPSKDVYTRLNF